MAAGDYDQVIKPGTDEESLGFVADVSRATNKAVVDLWQIASANVVQTEIMQSAIRLWHLL